MSKLTLYDWRCAKCGLKFESLQQPDVFHISCVECDGSSKRLISAPTIAISGTDPDFPTAYGKWEKTQKNKRKVEKEYYAKHGQDKTWGGDISGSNDPLVKA